jgi:ABC-type multidrug transport system ATPase subunit
MTAAEAMRRIGEPPGSSLAVSTTGLTRRSGEHSVVDGATLAISAESVCGFVGPNGAGKTATISMLLGLVRPTAGGSGCRERHLTRWRPTEARA